MASTPRFLASGFGPPAIVSTANAALDGSGSLDDVCTCSSASGGLFTGAEVHATEDATATSINFFHKSGSTIRFIGRLTFTLDAAPTDDQQPSLIGLFTPVGGPVELAQNDKIQAAAAAGTFDYSVRALGGNF